MNRLRYTHIYTFLLILGALLTCASCVRDYNSLEEEDDGNKYLTLTLSLSPGGNDELRAQGPDYSINSDKTNREDYVNDLRIFLIQNGQIKKNVFFTNLISNGQGVSTASDPNNSNFDYSYKKGGKATISFKLEESELGTYDLVVVANEGAYTNRPSLDPGPLPPGYDEYNREKKREEEAEAELKKALTEAKTLEALKKIRIPVTRRFCNTHQGPLLDINNPYIDPLSPMTAEYKGVTFSRGGSKESPQQIILPTHTGGIELLRTFAKVEIIIKECVLLTLDENGKEHLQWRGPWGFHSVDTEVRKVPKTTSLFPLNEYCDVPEFTVEHIGRLQDDRAVPIRTRFIVGYEDKIKEIRRDGFPIGGGYLFDYRHYFYLPEKLVPQGAVGDEKALYLLFEWGYYGAHDPWKDMAGDHKPIIKEEVFNFESKNEGANDYIKRNPPAFDPSSKSVYRNSLYRITIIPYKLDAPK